MPARVLRLATRGSPLALTQTELVAAGLRRAVPGLEVEAVVVSTRGDRLADVPLSQLSGQGVFVKEVQAAVLDGRADAAVHSAKDLPPVVPEGLVVACVPVRADVRDALVGCTLDGLPAGGAVATGSARRRAQLANLRPDLTFIELRGNMATRLDRVDGDGVDCVVVALAALERLGWAGRVAQVLAPSVCLPQIGQGALALECRVEDEVTRGRLGALDDPVAHAAVDAERALLASLGAGCTMPVGGWARVPTDPGPDGPDGGGDGEGDGDGDGEGAGTRLLLEGMLASGDGRVVVRATARGRRPGPLGREVARLLRDQCGAESIPGWAATPPEAP